jgi:hypothetical protein
MLFLNIFLSHLLEFDVWFLTTNFGLSVPVAARSKTGVYGHSLDEIVGSNPTDGMDVCLLWMLYVVR